MWFPPSCSRSPFQIRLINSAGRSGCPEGAFGRSHLGWLGRRNACASASARRPRLNAKEGVRAVNACLIAAAACILLGGKTAARTGARGATACGLLLFTLASAVIATAEATPWLPMGC